jgi:hypothetical protein
LKQLRALDADSAEGFIEALGIGRRLKVEAARWGLVHHGAPECDMGAVPSGDLGPAKRPW